MTGALVSVLMPAKDVGARVGQAVASCLAQSWRELEVIVLDDGSQDDTPDVVRALGDSRVRLERSERPVGLDVLHNRGLALARGELVARLDADDTMLPGRIARQVAFLDAHPEVGLVGTRAFVVDERQDRAPRLFYHFDGRPLHWALHAGCPLLHPTVMFRRAALPPGGYPTGTRFAHDWALFLALTRTTRLACLPEPGIIYRRHAGAVGVQRTAAQEESARLVLARHLRVSLGLSPAPSSVAAWVHPVTAPDVSDVNDLVTLARALAPDTLTLATAPPWDAAGLARCRRLYLARLLTIAGWSRRMDVARALLPLALESAAALARGALLG